MIEQNVKLSTRGYSPDRHQIVVHRPQSFNPANFFHEDSIKNEAVKLNC